MDFYNFLLGDPNPGESDEESLEEILTEMEIADSGGFYGCFVAEHHNDRVQSLLTRPAIFLAALAMRTKYLHFGTMITVLGIHEPYFVAEEIATLDSLSGGRVEYGFGAGGFGWTQVGISRQGAKERLEEGVLLIKRLLAAGKDEAIDYEGKYWSGTAAGVVPTVIQRPHPPFWISGHSQETIEQAARLGTNLATGMVPREMIAARRRAYHVAWEKSHGDTPPGRVGNTVLVCVGDSRKEIEEIAIPKMKTRLHQFARNTLGKRDDPTFSFEQALRERYYVDSWDDLLRAGIVIYGTEEQCINQIGEISQTDGEALLLWARFGDLDRAFCRESVGRLAHHVLPKVGGRPVAETQEVVTAGA